MSATDAELIAGVLGCRFEALAAIYEQHSVVVHATALELCGHRADEIVRSVFLTLWHAPSAYDPDRGTLAEHLAALTAAAARAHPPAPDQPAVDLDLTRTARTGLGDILRAIADRAPFGSGRTAWDRRSGDGPAEEAARRRRSDKPRHGTDMSPSEGHD